MSTIAPEQAQSTLPTPGRVPYRLSVEKYEAMVASGVFTKRDRLELIEGMLVEKMTKGRRHSVASVNSRLAIERVLPEGWHVEVENPVRIPTRRSMPEPDISVVRGVADDYQDLDPGPPDVALVVEVSDSSLEDDRAMAQTYGGGGIPVYWLVDLVNRRLQVSAHPVERVYPHPTILGETEAVELILGGQAVARIAVADLLPRP